jgi:hypothetical protein
MSFPFLVGRKMQCHLSEQLQGRLHRAASGAASLGGTYYKMVLNDIGVAVTLFILNKKCSMNPFCLCI